MATNDLGSARFAADDRISLAEASSLARRDRKTLMKDIAAGRFPHTAQAPDGRRGWTLIVQDLVDAGLVRADAVTPPRLRPGGTVGITPEQLRVLELEAQVKAQDAVADELRAEVARLHELAHALIARLGTPTMRSGGAE